MSQPSRRRCAGDRLVVCARTVAYAAEAQAVSGESLESKRAKRASQLVFFRVGFSFSLASCSGLCFVVGFLPRNREKRQETLPTVRPKWTVNSLHYPRRVKGEVLDSSR